MHSFVGGLRATIVLVCAFYLHPAIAETIGRVVGVSDGDTITVLTAEKSQIKVRLAGIDAPEKGQAFGQKSKAALSDCAYGKHTVLVGAKLDRYGRLIAKVKVGNTDCNLRQLRLGLAWHYKKYQSEQEPTDRALYADEEVRARSVKAGLWAESGAVPPWDYRKRK